MSEIADDLPQEIKSWSGKALTRCGRVRRPSAATSSPLRSVAKGNPLFWPIGRPDLTADSSAADQAFGRFRPHPGRRAARSRLCRSRCTRLEGELGS